MLASIAFEKDGVDVGVILIAVAFGQRIATCESQAKPDLYDFDGA